MRVLVGLLLLSGCDRVLGLDRDGICVGGNGSGIVGLLNVCLDPETATDYVPRASISTGTPGMDPGDCTEVVTQTDVLKTEICVISAPTIALNSPLTISGSRPLVFVAAGELSVLVDLDLSSGHPATVNMVLPPTPGSSYAGCPNLDGDGAPGNSTGASGAAGGSFGGTGGNGGRGAVPGTVAVAPMTFGFVRGGCDGGRGGAGAGSGGPGAAGRSGGALYLIAGTTLRIAATINTSGGAGTGGGKSDGNSHQSGAGGGGGSGGLIGMDAQEVILEPTALLLSNGGGGGGGGGGGSPTITTTVGMAGNEARTSSAPPFQTLGGAGGTAGGGQGGSGGDRDATATSGHDQLTAGGGGGGGGGTGRIVVFADTLTDLGAVSSPAVEKR